MEFFISVRRDWVLDWIKVFQIQPGNLLLLKIFHFHFAFRWRYELGLEWMRLHQVLPIQAVINLQRRCAFPRRNIVWLFRMRGWWVYRFHVDSCLLPFLLQFRADWLLDRMPACFIDLPHHHWLLLSMQFLKTLVAARLRCWILPHCLSFWRFNG